MTYYFVSEVSACEFIVGGHPLSSMDTRHRSGYGYASQLPHSAIFGLACRHVPYFGKVPSHLDFNSDSLPTQPQPIYPMAIPYDEALSALKRIAHDVLSQRGEVMEHVPLNESLGRVAAQSHKSLMATPPFDTAAMDGYALSSAATAGASEDSPAVFAIKGTIAAGDEPIVLCSIPNNETLPCVEIMTGARFPRSIAGPQLDACVKIENTSRTVGSPTSEQQIRIVQPVARNANRRFAGSDFQEGDLLLAKGEVIRSRHIMTLASVGIANAVVRRRLRVAVWSTGNELRRGSSDPSLPQTMDTNGPFLIAALRELGARVDFKGILEDKADNLLKALSEGGRRDDYDVLLTTGAVSKGKFDFVTSTLKAMGASIHFHGVAIRPGHPVLFASLPLEDGDRPFFGLPGNPVATAACFRFLVLPFIRQLMGIKQLQPYPAKIEARNGCRDLATCCPCHLDSFRHGSLRKNDRGENVVVLSEDQSPAKVSYFATSNCWVHVPKRQVGNDLDSILYCYPHSMNELV